MESKKRLPIGLTEKQEIQRQDTINKVSQAAADIKNEGKKVTISALAQRTGLSRSTFAKPHIRKLLMEHGYAPIGKGNAKGHGKKQNKKVLSKDNTIADLRAKNAELEQECELLRGRLFLAMQN